MARPLVNITQDINGILQALFVQYSDDFRNKHGSLAIADFLNQGWWNLWQTRIQLACLFIYSTLKAMEVHRQALLPDVSLQTKKVMPIDLSCPYSLSASLSLSFSLSTNPLSSEGTNIILRPPKKAGCKSSDRSD